jgi:hypothetical protein
LSSRLISKNVNIRIYTTIILPVVSCWFKIWYRTSREEDRLRLSENRVLGRIFGPERDEGTGGWRKSHKD